MNKSVTNIQPTCATRDGRKIPSFAAPFLNCLLACTSATFFACSSAGTSGSTNEGGATINGGTTNTGGSSNKGGATGTGGAPATGGSSGKGGAGGTTATGGSTGKGGAGGTTATGGSSGKGGTTGTGSMTGTGGISSTGGLSGKGGTAGIGGIPATGGLSGKGGTTGTGGMTAAGGSSGKGGTTSTGGATGTGTCSTDAETKFSFFLISNAEMIRQGGADSSGTFSKYGGNLGGLAGADKICQTAAEHSSPCQSSKTWHAFLSTSTVDAIDRIGTGPWYDRMGRQWASSITSLLNSSGRPSDADSAIKNDAPNENGVPNQNPDGTGNVDNHETITGSGTDGRLYKETGGVGMEGGDTYCGLDVGASGTPTWSVARATCKDWTDDKPEGCPRVGHSWSGFFGSGTSWVSVWNEAGCAPGGTLADTGGTVEAGRTIGSAGGYGGFYCFAVVPNP